MKRNFIVHTQFWFAILALLTGTLPGRAQTWIQWRSAEGGNGHYYAVTPWATNWIAAQKLAVSWGGTLATITSSNEQEFVNATFLTGAFEHRPLWIGLSDPSIKGPLSIVVRRLEERIGLHPKVTLKWATGEPVSYGNWKPGEPNNQGGDEFYVAVNWEYSDNPPRGIKGDWNDTPLNGTAGFGGKTDGPYFGLVEREADPSQPIKWRFAGSTARLGLIAALVVVLVIWFDRFKRRADRAVN